MSFSVEKERVNFGIGRYDFGKYRVVQNSEVLFNDRKINLEGDVWAWTDELAPLYKDGLIGLPFLRKIGKKVTFDFVNMRLTAEE